MKQKIVLNVQMNCDKCRSKAMKSIASAEGVDSVAIEGEEKDQLVVIGDGVDAVRLTSGLRKKVGHACIISVSEVKKDEKKPKNEKPKDEKPKIEYIVPWCPNYTPPPQMVVYDGPYYSEPSPCSIM